MNQQLFQADVLVVGGGISGTVSAIAAAQQGVSVILVEKANCLGGCATSGLLGELNAPSLHGKNVLSNIGQEIIQRLIENHAALAEYDVPMTANPNVHVDRLRYNSEYMKIVLDEMTAHENIKVFLGAEVKSAARTDNVIQLNIVNAYETVTLQGSLLIDSTGNSQCIYQLGGKTEITERKKLQAVTMIFRMGGIDMDAFLKTSVSEIQEIISLGVEKNILPARILSMLRIPGTNDIAINCTRCLKVNHESLEEISKTYFTLRQQIKHIVPFIKENVPGCQNAYLNNIASALGIRDRRKTIGLYELTGDDLIHCRDFEDAVAIGVYPIDIHNPSQKGLAVSFQQIEGSGIYKIPYRSLIPCNLENVLVNGKGICADDRAFGAFRVMGPLINIATAAGTAAAMTVQAGCRTRDLDITALKARLRECGMKEI